MSVRRSPPPVRVRSASIDENGDAAAFINGNKKGRTISPLTSSFGANEIVSVSQMQSEGISQTNGKTSDRIVSTLSTDSTDSTESANPWSKQSFSVSRSTATAQEEKLSHESSTKALISNCPNQSKIKQSVIQTGLDRYMNIQPKRKLSPQKQTVDKQREKIKKICEDGSLRQNRFAILDNSEEITKSKSTGSKSKPPPIYLREKNSNSLVNNLAKLLGANNFHVVSVMKGNIHETKIQIYEEENFRKLVNNFDLLKKEYYTYQLKSSKGLVVILKGVEHNVDPSEIKGALEEAGFEIKSIFNIKNRNKVPQPMFRIELEPSAKSLKKGEVHPIYNLRYLLHRKISIEEPLKRKSPVQCTNCQEFGHTRSYCNLPSVCVICGDLHSTSTCSKPKQDASVKKCSNCGENHTANYRGCPVFLSIKQKELLPNSKPVPPTTVTNLNSSSRQPIAQPQYQSYANVLKTNPNVEANNMNNCGIESMLQTLVQTLNQFMVGMQSMIQDLIRNQTILMQTLLNKP